MMQNREVQKRLQEINRLFDMDTVSNDLAEHWGRYLCITVAIFLETALREIYESYADETAGGNLANYVSSQIGRTIGTPNSERIISTEQAFNKDWADELRSFLAQDGRRAAINAMRPQRNAIAHGRPVTISPAQVREYLDKCVAVLEFIEGQCLAQPQPPG